MATIIPKRYNPIITNSALFLKNTLVNKRYTGSRALQLIRGRRNMQVFLSLSLSKVLVPMIAGTVQPKLIIIGKNAFPDSPKSLINLSIIIAALDIYPQLSRKVKHTNIQSITGKNTKTEPTPATIPSRIND